MNTLTNLKLERVVIEVFGGCNYTCQMCPQGQSPGRDKEFLRKMPLTMFEDILDQITPKYGTPIINLEGSGEPTLAKDLALYVEACTKRGLKTFMYCNGSHFHGQYMKDVIDAGLSQIRFSVIGYNRELYKQWMGVDNWDLIYNNTADALAYTKAANKQTSIESYHLILDPNDVAYEIDQYRKNFIDAIGTRSYIWKMHNWSGNVTNLYQRDGNKRSCGRPSAAELTVRAGGLNWQQGAVTPCCQTMGPPNESLSVLGHFSNQTFEEIWTGEAYNNLRRAHELNEYAELAPYCDNCDFLIDEPEVIVWSTESVDIGTPLGTSLKFNQ